MQIHGTLKQIGFYLAKSLKYYETQFTIISGNMQKKKNKHKKNLKLPSPSFALGPVPIHITSFKHKIWTQRDTAGRIMRRKAWPRAEVPNLQDLMPDDLRFS